jgi:hypothetical protein
MADPFADFDDAFRDLDAMMLGSAQDTAAPSFALAEPQMAAIAQPFQQQQAHTPQQHAPPPQMSSNSAHSFSGASSPSSEGGLHPAIQAQIRQAEEAQQQQVQQQLSSHSLGSSPGSGMVGSPVSMSRSSPNLNYSQQGPQSQPAGGVGHTQQTSAPARAGSYSPRTSMTMPASSRMPVSSRVPPTGGIQAGGAPDLLEQQWYVGSMPRPETENLLASTQARCFVVR